MYRLTSVTAKLLGVAAALAMLVMACGPAAQPTAAPTATATTPPKPTATTTAASTPTPTAVAVVPTPTRAPVATPTQAVAQATPTSTPQTEQPKRGGIVTFSAAEDISPANMDVATVISSTGLYVFGPVLNGLVQFDPYSQTKFIGDLAEKWTISSDGKEVTFQLRKDVTWHDGVKLTSEDIAWNLDRILNPPQGYRVSDLRETIKSIDKVETPDAYTVKLSLKYASASLMANFGVVRLLMFPKHLGIDAFMKQPVGTGPYKWVAARKSVSIELARNENYFKPGLPYLDGVKIFIMPDASGLAAFRTAKIDFLDPASNALMGRSAEIMKELPGIRMPKHVAGSRLLVLNSVAPFVDQRGRTAVNLAIDRQQARIASLGDAYGFASVDLPPGIGGIWGLPEAEMSTMPGFRQPKTQDLADAQRLFKEAGATGLKPLNFIIEERNSSWGIVAVQQLAAAGLDVKMNVLERATFLASLGNGSFDMALVTVLPGLDDPSQAVGPYFLSNAPRNYGKFKSQRVDDLYAQQDATWDAAKRKALVYEMEREITNWAIMPSMGWGLRPVGIHPWVKNLPDPAMFWSNVYRMEQVWLSK